MMLVSVAVLPLLTLTGNMQILHAAGKESFDLAEPKRKPPTLIVVVLPEGATDIYTAVKQ